MLVVAKGRGKDRLAGEQSHFSMSRRLLKRETEHSVQFAPSVSKLDGEKLNHLLSCAGAALQMCGERLLAG